jgi:hypothetical protein
MAIVLGENNYGKSSVRLMKVSRHADRHDLLDWNIDIQLQGDFLSAHTEGDNSKILPTDTMRSMPRAIPSCLDSAWRDIFSATIRKCRMPALNCASIPGSEFRCMASHMGMRSSPAATSAASPWSHNRAMPRRSNPASKACWF